MRDSGNRNAWRVLGAVVVLMILMAALVWEFQRTASVRGSVRSFSALVSAANRGDVGAVRRLCSRRYRAAHPITLAPEGGVVGLPRNIHRNFQTWDRETEVWISPGNRVGPVYRMVRNGDTWVFDGLAGYLAPDGNGGVAMVRAEE